MAQEYTVFQWKAWTKEDGSVMTDDHGNVLGSVIFDEAKSEPADARFKTEPKPGDKKYGDIVEYQTKTTNKTRLKFQRADRPKEQPGSSGSGWQPRDDDGIRASMAVKESYRAFVSAAGFVPASDNDWQTVQLQAVSIYDMIDRVKGSQAAPEALQATQDTEPAQSSSQQEPDNTADPEPDYDSYEPSPEEVAEMDDKFLSEIPF